MKKILALLLALVMVFALAACGGGSSSQSSAPAAAAPAAEEEKSPEEVSALDQLIADAQAEGELVVYGSCEEDYLSAATSNFEKLYGIKTTYQRLSTVRFPPRSRRRTASPPPTSGSAAPTTPTTAWPPRAFWTTPTSP